MKELGPFPGSDEKIAVMAGRYGPYIKCGKVNATLPKDVTPETVTLEQAVELINAKGGPGAGKAKKAPAKKAAAPKKAAPKTAAKKAPSPMTANTVTAKKPAAKKAPAKKAKTA